jgi:hypothetical protein
MSVAGPPKYETEVLTTPPRRLVLEDNGVRFEVFTAVRIMTFMGYDVV